MGKWLPDNILFLYFVKVLFIEGLSSLIIAISPEYPRDRCQHLSSVYNLIWHKVLKCFFIWIDSHYIELANSFCCSNAGFWSSYKISKATRFPFVSRASKFVTYRKDHLCKFHSCHWIIETSFICLRNDPLTNSPIKSIFKFFIQGSPCRLIYWCSLIYSSLASLRLACLLR